MRRLLLLCLTLFIAALSRAQQPGELKDLFRQMPDSLLPVLSQNNRLDFIDFYESGMKAEVENLLGGTSRMTVLTADSLLISMTACSRVDMLLFTLDEPQDSLLRVVALVETFLVDSLYGESCVQFYTPDWHPVTLNIPLNQAQQQRLETLRLQNILKWGDKVLKNS